MAKPKQTPTPTTEILTRAALEAAAADLVEVMQLAGTEGNEVIEDPEQIAALSDEELAQLIIDTVNNAPLYGTERPSENGEIDSVLQATKDVLQALGCDPGAGVKVEEAEAPAETPAPKAGKKEKPPKAEKPAPKVAERGEPAPLDAKKLKKMDRNALLASAKAGNFRVPPPFLKDEKEAVEKLRAYVAEQWAQGPIVKQASGPKERKPKAEMDEFGFRKGSNASRFIEHLKAAGEKGTTMAEAAEALGEPKGTTFYAPWKKLLEEKKGEKRDGRLFLK